MQQRPGCASCWPDQKAPQQSKFKYQACLICPSKLRNKAALPNYQQYKHTAPFKSGRRAFLVFSASQGINPVLPTPHVSSVSCLPNLESFRAGNRTPCLDSHHLHRFMLASQASWPPAHPRSPYALTLCPFVKNTKHNKTKPIKAQESSRALPARLKVASCPESLTYLLLLSTDTSLRVAALLVGEPILCK